VSLKAAEDLEWGELCAALAGRCRNEVAVERLRALLPAESLEEARDRMRLTGEALEALAQAEPVPALEVREVSESIEHVRRGGVASGEDLGAIGKMLESAKALRAYARAHRELERLSAALDSDGALDAVAKVLARAIDEHGRVVDDASPELADARAREKRARRALQEKLAAMMSRHEDVLREGGFVERDGRYGLPVRSDAHRRVEGIVLGSSGSGATVFVEPPEVTAIVNRLKMAEADSERAEEKVRIELSAAVAGRAEEALVAYEACIRADVLAALSSWAQKARAIAIVVDEGSSIELVCMRHPLLVLQGAVVPTDVELAAGNALIISGPNAGGKTVALKCLGLAVYMARAGIPLPLAEGSRVGWFDDVLTDIGDSQSLSRSLSTFSAEVENMSGILARADDRTLVLLDEVAGGTDPEEGAALAAAVLESLVARGAAVAVTTHYEKLKELAASHDAFVNASVGFDFDAMRPTFVLTMGVPGASSALAVAARFGMPADVVERAQSLLSEVAVQREELIVQLERERRALSTARESAERDAVEAESLRREMEVERREVRQKEKKRLTNQAAELAAAVRKARSDLRRIESDVKSRDTLSDVKRRVDEAGRLVSIDGALTTAARAVDEKREELSASDLSVGTRVFIERLGVVAEIAEPPERGQVRVRAGALALRVPIDELRKAPAGAPRAPAPKVAAPRAPEPPRDIERSIRTMTNTCDLRGQRVGEALEQLDRFIDALSLGGDPIGFALHGHGTGALKRAVREHLALSSRVTSFRAANTDEGGDAFTVFRIRS